MQSASLTSIVVFLSGFAGLGYEIVWIRMFAVGLGHEMPAVLAVVSAFFCGLAAGSWFVERIPISADQPGRTYVALELLIGSWAVATTLLIPSANGIVAQLTGPMPPAWHQWLVAFLVPFVLLLPATCAMGATLPIMVRIISSLDTSKSSVAGLYAANTFGAAAGTALATFVIIPQFGYSNTLGCFAILNFICAAMTLLMLSGSAPLKLTVCHREATVSATTGSLLLTLFLTGVLGIGYEVLVVRVLSQVVENTVYSFASALVVYLFGTACGAAAYKRFAGRCRRHENTLPFLLAALSGLCLIGSLFLWHADTLYGAVRAALGAGMVGSILAEMTLAAAAFLPMTMAMGATFSHLAENARTQRLGFGGALCINTLGSALGPLVAGVVMVQLVGLKLCFIVEALAYLFLIVLSGSWRYRPALLPLVAAIAMALIPGPLRLVSIGRGETVVDHVEGVMASVTIVRDSSDDYHLKVNNHFQMGGTSSAFSDRRQGNIPLLLHPQPEQALFLGLGTAGTFAVAADHPGLHAEGVELVPEIVPRLHYFLKSTGNLATYPDLSVIVADARRYVKASTKTYDVVVADLFHPARDGAGSLYTVEHFAAIRSLLNDGGLFCQWLPLYQLDLDTLRLIIRTFLSVFPEGSAWLAHYSLKSPIIGLVGTKGAITYTHDWFHQRVQDQHLAQKLRTVRLYDDYTLFGGYLAGSAELRKMVGRGPLNTDDRPLVIFRAPRFVYGGSEPTVNRLLTLLDALSAEPKELFGSSHNENERWLQRRLAAYWSARNQFIRAGVGIRETDDVRRLVAAAREPLLNIVRQSPDFEAAYQPLLAMAVGLHKVDPEAAKNLLVDLERANPYRDDASNLRLRLSDGVRPAP